jgi:hypothetical protein
METKGRKQPFPNYIYPVTAKGYSLVADVFVPAA